MDNSHNTNILQKSQKCRLVLFPLPFQGHINPMIQLANILHTKGFTISIIHTRFNFPNPSKYPHFTFHFISDCLSETKTSTNNVSLIVKLLNDNCLEPFRNCLAQLLSDDVGVTCLITDALWYFTQAVADSFNLPRVVLRTSNVCSFLAFNALPLLRDKGYLTNMDSRMEEAVVELPPLKVKDIPTVKSYEPTVIFEIIRNMMNETKKASGLIFNTFKELEETELDKLQHEFLMPVFPIGPFHKCFSASQSSLLTQDRSSISWLDTQESKTVLYISFGSIASMDSEKLVEVAWGIANSMKPFLWAVRPGLIDGSDWLEMLPSEFLEATSNRGCIVKWTPQQEVLSHRAIGGFWTHGGWNSTLESICEGVPMICSAFFGDQMVDSRYVNDVWKIGIKLEKGLQRREIEDAIRKLFVESEGLEMKKRVMILKEKADFCLKSNGSSYQSLDALVNLISSFESST